ncbi:MAG: phytanoyl-CoA dioxygenase family protein [Alphaproteobacteria bacterium]|nr:phytanoyl-CoA dioxygenase family protein [Alphaproteobacteria bacterium]
MQKWESNFKLINHLDDEQLNFFKLHGVILFRNFLNKEQVKLYLDEISRIEQDFLANNTTKINGTPLKFGKNEDGTPNIQRMCFGSHYSQALKNILHDPRLLETIKFMHPYQGRIGENEKDGLVINNYINTPNSNFSQMGWHTDSPRDLFLFQKIMPMLNVGIHLDNCLFQNGGLRVIPGTQNQSLFKLLFAKKYFLDNSDDPREVGFDIQAGDLTVHDGRLWHRVKQSPLVGEASRRRVMYIPMITGKVKLKHAKSRTPFYHKFAHKVK